MRIPKALKIPDKYQKPRAEWSGQDPEYYFPRALYTSNPGGVGHAYIKRAFMCAPPGQKHAAPADDGGLTRLYIPARVDDNPSLNREQVKKGLSGLPPQLVDALLNGNWNAVVGAYFPEIDREVHIIPAFAIPPHWVRIMAMDWGACGDGDPFSIGWAAVSDGTISHIPRGALIFYRRWNGRGLPKVLASQVAIGIHQRERFDAKITIRVAGGDILETRGTGESLHEIFAKEGIFFQRADTRRESGWAQVRERLIGKAGQPAIYWFPEAAEDLETIGNLQHDKNNPNDCAAGDDHDADRVRYLCMARPYIRDAPAQELSQEKKYKLPTLDQTWEILERQAHEQR